MFALKEATAKLTNLNLRAEIHGEEYKTAVDLQIEIKVSNDLLAEFDESLKPALYRAAEEGDEPTTDLFKDQPGYMPKLKFPLMGALKWNYENAGYGVTVHRGISSEANILMILCKVDKFKFDCQEGGTVIIGFRIVAHPEPEELGHLSELIQQEITLTLDPPTAEEIYQQQLKAAGEGDNE